MKRCDSCTFWVVGEQWGGAKSQQKHHPDDRLGSCHRNAPQTSLGDWNYHVLEALVLMIGPDAADQNEHLIQNWEECTHAQPAIWPTTAGNNWCGEYQSKVPQERT